VRDRSLTATVAALPSVSQFPKLLGSLALCCVLFTLAAHLSLVRSMPRALIVFALAIVCSAASAQTGAGGFVYGKDHAYFLEAPKGWVLDSGDAAKEDVGGVFHPANAHWPESGVIIYTDFYKKRKGLQTPSDAMENDIALF